MKILLYSRQCANAYIPKCLSIWWSFLVAALLVACGDQKQEQQELPVQQLGALGTYRINEPDQVFELPDELEEISGLDMLSETQLLCNEDETGHIYLFDLAQQAVTHKWKWGEDGDYEGLALMEGNAYVLKSNGFIYRVHNYDQKDNQQTVVERLETGLDQWCDAEGLCRLPGTNGLLIACKEGEPGQRTIYLFVPGETGSLAVPYLELDLAEVEDRLLTTDLDKLSLQLRKLLDPRGASGILFPSGIAVHPITQDLYILSARSKILVVYSQEGELKEVAELRHEKFIQPEAITFAPNADLYIGNEGAGGRANILKFSYVQQ